MNLPAFLRLFFIPCKENGFRPQFFESGVPIALIVFVLLFKFLDFTLLLSLPATSFFPQLANEEILQLTNNERSKRGLAPLRRNPQLETAAFLKGQDMLARGYFSHTDPAGNPPWYWIEKAGYRYASAGENLATGFLDATEVVDAWIASPSHLANIINPRYQEIGIAVFRKNVQGRETTLVVQFFASPAQSKTAVRETKTMPQQPSQKEASQEQSPAVLGETEEISNVISPPQIQAPESMTASQQASEIQTQEKTKAPTTLRVVKTLRNEGATAIEQITLSILFFIILALTLMIFIRFEIQHHDLTFRAFLFVAVIALLLLADREFFLSLIPHRLII